MCPIWSYQVLVLLERELVHVLGYHSKDESAVPGTRYQLVLISLFNPAASFVCLVFVVIVSCIGFVGVRHL